MMLSGEPRWMLILHRCPVSKLALCQEVPDAADARCVPPAELGECGAPILPDQPARAGHAWVFCPHCGISVGLCGALAVEALAVEAGGLVG